jgi:hypothetical protein
MNPRELKREDLITVIKHVGEVTGCREFVVSGRSALIMFCENTSLLCTQDFDIGITLENELKGLKTFEAKLGKASPYTFLIEQHRETLAQVMILAHNA